MKKDWHHLKEIANDNEKKKEQQQKTRPEALEEEEQPGQALKLVSFFVDFPNSNQRNAYEKFSFRFHKNTKTRKPK